VARPSIAEAPLGTGAEPTPEPTPGVEPPGRARDLVVAALLAASLGATAPYFGRLMNANERPRLLQAMAWVDEAELAVDGPAARGIAAGIDVARSPIDGRLYPNKPPGGTLPAVVAYAGLRSVAALGGPTPTLRSLTIAARVLGGLVPVLVLLWLLARRLRARGAGRGGDAAVLVLALATPLAAYARLLFGHALAACLLLAGMLLVLDATAGANAHDAQARPDPARATAGGSSRRALVGGMLAASAVEYAAAFAGLPLAVLLAWRLRRGAPRGPLVAAIVGALVPVVALAGYHAAVFGKPWSTGYHHVTDAGFARTHGEGLLGLAWPTGTSLFEHLVSPWGGLLVWAPLVALGLGMALWQWRALDVEERVATAVLVVLTVVVMGLGPTGGWRVGPRYLVLAMPLAAYGLVRLLHAVRERPWQAGVVLGVALASAMLDVLAATLFPHLVPHGNPWADLLLPLAIEGRMPYSVVPGAGGVAPWALALVVLVPLSLLGWGLVRGLVPPAPAVSRARRTAVVVGLGVAIAAGVSIAALALPGHPQAARDLADVRSIWEPDGPRPTPERELAPLFE
jgi:hypothetical protein